MRYFRARAIATLVALILSLTPSLAPAQTVVKSGFNIFSAQQDVEIGRQSAAQIEQQIPMITRSDIAAYVSKIGARLAAVAPGERYPYQFKVANLSDINAFALPGGFVYVHRGLIEKVRSEGELAGVMAHEISHVALRHQTNQASKAYLAQAGVAVLGGLLGHKSQSSVIQAVGGFGLNALFLHYSRSAEQQADIVGAQIMAKAGYDPNDMARFFDLLRQEAGRDPGKVERFFSDHPAPADRAARVRKEAGALQPVHLRPVVGGLSSVQSQLRRMAPAPTLAQATQGKSVSTSSASTNGASIESPSGRYRTFRQPRGIFQVQIPTNWQAYTSTYGGTFAPRGGIVPGSNGGQELQAGVIIGHYVPFDGAVGASYENTSLDAATSDLVRHITNAYPYLNPVQGSVRSGIISGGQSESVALSGTSPRSGIVERMTVTTRELQDGHVMYVIAVAPREDYPDLQPAFDRVVRTLDVNDEAQHD